jgi:cell fate regulator YaaT (PSP1 superfamily)
VETEQGLEWGVCILPNEPCSPEMAQRITDRVIRQATVVDMDSYRQLEQEEKKAGKLCQEHMDKRKLPMQLADVEYTFDRHKVTFYFTAENRVDFRDLVRDLARELHSRIELRHIQVRDRSKIVGGLGCCGRILCCNSFLDEFVPISMRMAKCQNLSLNPNKISGQCGRLLCCLNYESEVYERGEVRHAPPPILDADFDETQIAAMEDDLQEKRRTSRIVVEAPTVSTEEQNKENSGQQHAGSNAANTHGKRKNKKKKNKKRGKGNKGEKT